MTMDQVDRVVEFLAKCGDADIEAGIGALFGFGGDQRIAEFREGLRRAIAGDDTPSRSWAEMENN